MATYHHMVCTDDNPQHNHCPEENYRLCKWQQAKALGMESEAHPDPLHPNLQKDILPIYGELSEDELLTRC